MKNENLLLYARFQGNPFSSNLSIMPKSLFYLLFLAHNQSSLLYSLFEREREKENGAKLVWIVVRKVSAAAAAVSSAGPLFSVSPISGALWCWDICAAAAIMGWVSSKPEKGKQLQEGKKVSWEIEWAIEIDVKDPFHPMNLFHSRTIVMRAQFCPR